MVATPGKKSNELHKDSSRAGTVKEHCWQVSVMNSNRFAGEWEKTYPQDVEGRALAISGESATRATNPMACPYLQ